MMKDSVEKGNGGGVWKSTECSRDEGECDFVVAAKGQKLIRHVRAGENRQGSKVS